MKNLLVIFLLIPITNCIAYEDAMLEDPTPEEVGDLKPDPGPSYDRGSGSAGPKVGGGCGKEQVILLDGESFWLPIPCSPFVDPLWDPVPELEIMMKETK